MRTKCSPLLILTLLASGVAASAQGVQSVYTTFDWKKCKTLEEDEQAAGYILVECPGIAGYKLHVDSQDSRDGLTVIRPDGSEHTLNVGYLGGGAFSSIGQRIEWRVRREKGGLVPIALIVRFSISEQGPNGEREVPYLTVSKITPQKICLIESILAGRNSNVKARRLADNSADKPCYEPFGPQPSQ
jgi:hypothetical protein